MVRRNTTGARRTTSTRTTSTARTSAPKKKLTQFRPSIRSRHPSHRVLRASTGNLPLFPFRSLVRLGSTTVREGYNSAEADEATYHVVVNTAASIAISSNKLRMKEAFERAGVNTAPWFTATSLNGLLATASNLTDGWAENQKIVAKKLYGSKGQGNTLIHSEAELREWVSGKTLSQYIFEKYLPYSLEYRLHVTADGYFYTNRKAMRTDTPEEERWHYHDSTCVWLLETNPNFKRPTCWNQIVDHCIRALNEIGADLLSFDVKVQNDTVGGRQRPMQDFIILECNSASSLGDPNDLSRAGICAEKYIEEIPRIIRRKAGL